MLDKGFLVGSGAASVGSNVWSPKRNNIKLSRIGNKDAALYYLAGSAVGGWIIKRTCKDASRFTG